MADRFDYHYEQFTDTCELVGRPNALGAEGWEAVGYSNYGNVQRCIVLKRRAFEEPGERRIRALDDDDGGEEPGGGSDTGWMGR